VKEVVSVRIYGRCLPKDFGGIACYAYIIRNKDGHLLHEACGIASEPNSQSSTNNNAIYTALIKALEWLIGHGYEKDIITVKTSSKLLIAQLDESYHLHSQIPKFSKNLIPLHKKAIKLKLRFNKLSLELISNGKASKDDDACTDLDSKEVEELAILAYLEAKESIFRENNNGQKTHFVTAAQLMKKNG
jgi:ribonuclease HI